MAYGGTKYNLYFEKKSYKNSIEINLISFSKDKILKNLHF